jgi:DNA repair protein RecN (Recombination protein N)
MDVAQFFISTNEGEDLRPLIKVASGGEISRIMLALKSVIARKGHVPTLVFDEIDNGVSGRIARAVGNRLKELSACHQVLCITHLPQIASLGEHHWFVEKQTRDGRTVTRFRKLAGEERATEIAKLLAGEKITEIHIDNARQLLQEAGSN